MKLKKGDKVVVIAGKSRGKSGAIVRVLRQENRVVIDGLNLVKLHQRPTQRNRKGQIIDRAMPIHVSNVMMIDPKTGKRTRIRIVRSKDGTRERMAVKSGETIK